MILKKDKYGIPRGLREDVDPSPEYGKVDDWKSDIDGVDSKLDLLKFATKVQSTNINKDISSDFVMAKFNDVKDREGIIEMTNNAYFCKRMLLEMKKATVWEYDKNKSTWILRSLFDSEKKKIDDVTSQMFGTFMVRSSVTAVLNRNVKDNYLLRLISGLDTEESETKQEEQAIEKTTNRFAQILSKVGIGKKNEEQEG